MRVKKQYNSLQITTYQPLTKFHVTFTSSLFVVANLLREATSYLYGCSICRSKAIVINISLSPIKIRSFCLSYISYTNKETEAKNALLIQDKENSYLPEFSLRLKDTICILTYKQPK